MLHDPIPNFPRWHARRVYVAPDLCHFCSAGVDIAEKSAGYGPGVVYKNAVKVEYNSQHPIHLILASSLSHAGAALRCEYNRPSLTEAQSGEGDRQCYTCRQFFPDCSSMAICVAHRHSLDTLHCWGVQMLGSCFGNTWTVCEEHRSRFGTPIRFAKPLCKG